jgi:hypothetical protein
MFDDVGGVARDAGNEQLAFRQFSVLPDAPFMLVTNIARFHRIGAGVDA